VVSNIDIFQGIVLKLEILVLTQHYICNNTNIYILEPLRQ